MITLTYYADGALRVPYESVPPDMRMALFSHGFQYHPHQAAFLLPATYGEVGRALRVQALTQKLAALGLGVNLRRHSATRAAASASPSTTSASAGARRQ